jgi:phosphate transport system permease protein
VKALRTIAPHPPSLFLRFLTLAAAGLTMAFICFLTGSILIRGIPHLRAGLFAWRYTSENVSFMPALINTVLITLAALALAVPAGSGAAIWLVEYARRGNKLVLAVRLAAETLAGLPSIIYGLFGMLLFVIFLGWGYSLLAGACTLAVMILPLILRTTEEALLCVPDAYREGSFGLGAGKLRTLFAVVLPSAAPGILAGVILGVGRIVGETAALIFTAGTVPELPDSPFSSTRTMAVHLYNLSGEGLHIDQAAAAAAALLVLVAGINALSAWGAKKISGARYGGHSQ